MVWKLVGWCFCHCQYYDRIYDSRDTCWTDERIQKFTRKSIDVTLISTLLGRCLFLFGSLWTRQNEVDRFTTVFDDDVVSLFVDVRRRRRLTFGRLPVLWCLSDTFNILLRTMLFWWNQITASVSSLSLSICLSLSFSLSLTLHIGVIFSPSL